MPKKHKKEISAPANKMAATCMDIKDDRECVKKGSKEGECAWCSGKFLPSACLGVDKAKYIPEQVGSMRCCICVKFQGAFQDGTWCGVCGDGGGVIG